MWVYSGTSYMYNIPIITNDSDRIVNIIIILCRYVDIHGHRLCSSTIFNITEYQDTPMQYTHPTSKEVDLHDCACTN